MAITLDTNLISLQQNLNISTMRMQNYANKSIDDIIEAEAKLGNEKAVEYAKELFKDEKEFIEAFKLDDPNNKFKIFSQMNEKSISEMLPLCELEDLALGINFFTKDKILALLEEAPIEQVIAMALQLFGIEDLLPMIPKEQLDNFMTSNQIKKNIMLKELKELPPETLAAMLETVTGRLVDKMDEFSLVMKLDGLPSDEYQDALKVVPEEQQRQILLNMYKEDEEILELISQGTYVNAIATLEKPEMMKGVGALDQEQVLKMLEDLPKELLATIATQIDTEVLAEILLEKYGDLIQTFIAA